MAYAHQLLRPVILLVAVLVLACSERVRHAFNCVDIRTSKVVRRKALERGAGARMRRVVAAESHRVTECAVVAGVIHLQPRTALLPYISAFHHLLREEALGFIGRLVASL